MPIGVRGLRWAYPFWMGKLRGPRPPRWKPPILVCHERERKKKEDGGIRTRSYTGRDGSKKASLEMTIAGRFLPRPEELRDFASRT